MLCKQPMLCINKFWKMSVGYGIFSLSLHMEKFSEENFPDYIEAKI